jgi:hypothetical protein
MSELGMRQNQNEKKETIIMHHRCGICDQETTFKIEKPPVGARGLWDIDDRGALIAYNLDGTRHIHQPLLYYE